MGDVETLILVSTALAGFGAVVQHFYDRFASNGLYRRTERRTREIPAQIGLEVEGALNRVAASQEAKYEEAARAAQADVEKQGKSLVMSGTRQIGIEKAQMKELQGLMVEGIGGPVFKAIEAWNPEWADKLRAVDPGLLLQFLESPWFVANIKPRIQPYMDKFLGSKTAGASDVNPFLKELGQ